MSAPKHKIYLAARPGPWGFEGVALAEDGTVLAVHCSSSPDWSQLDLGMHYSTRQHEHYNKHFGPGNWELEWVHDVTTHAGWRAALALNQKQGAVS